MAETCGKIFQAIPAIMSEISAVGKNKKSAQQGFMYRGVDDVMNAINPALTKHKVFIIPEVLEQSREDRQTNKGNNIIYSVCKIRFKFCAEDGSTVEAVTIGEGMDSGDKSMNKAMAIAFKYACFQVFCIPTEEMVDPDKESHDTRGPGRQAQGKKNGAAGEKKQNQQKNGESAEQSQQDQDNEKNRQMMEEAGNSMIDDTKIKVLVEKVNTKGVSERSILEYYQVESFKVMTVAQWMNAMSLLDKYQDKKAG